MSGEEGNIVRDINFTSLEFREKSMLLTKLDDRVVSLSSHYIELLYLRFKFMDIIDVLITQGSEMLISIPVLLVILRADSHSIVIWIIIERNKLSLCNIEQVVSFLIPSIKLLDTLQVTGDPLKTVFIHCPFISKDLLYIHIVLWIKLLYSLLNMLFYYIGYGLHELVIRFFQDSVINDICDSNALLLLKSEIGHHNHNFLHQLLQFDLIFSFINVQKVSLDCSVMESLSLFLN